MSAPGSPDPSAAAPPDRSAGASAAQERVPLYGPDGRPTGEVVTRARMRAENLRHAATSVLVRDSAGRIVVHRRTDTKDVYPGLYDFTAGGVLTAGEENDPHAAAVREVREELGIENPVLEPVGEGEYADAHARYHAFLFVCVHDGPLVLQEDEVAWADRVAPEDLHRMLGTGETEGSYTFVPDSRALWASSLSQLLPPR
ncbi:NUDIX domain-containing protein [Brevibacterium samyangense]|uniref:Nudix hydrolase domain-containing protein n=1 Tax=Brevibacterium samyangense TaxID=366888 RepID=A0ABN2T7M0_9MICO